VSDTTSQAVAFAVRGQLSLEEQEDVLDQVANLPGVRRAERLLPGSPLPDLARLGVATVEDDADPRAVAALIAALPDVEYADVPPDRGLPGFTPAS
jgi:hypothetical protein